MAKMLVNLTPFSIFNFETIFNFGFTVSSIYVQPNEVHNKSFAELPIWSKTKNTNRIFEH